MKYYSLIFGLLISTVVYAQQRFTGFLNTGITASQISGDGTHGFVQFGVNIGPSLQYQLNEPWLLETGLYFNQKGARRYQSQGNISTYRLRVNYIGLPILLVYHWNKFHFKLGPSFNVKINQKERTEFGEIDNPRIFEPVELAIFSGISYTLNEKWQLNLSYQNSLLPVRPHSADFAFPPTNFVLGEWHQEILNKGQYFSLFSLCISYKL